MKLQIFYDKEIPIVGSNHFYLPVIKLDSAPKKDKNYYPQVFLKEYRYAKKVIKFINDNKCSYFFQAWFAVVYRLVILLITLTKN